MQIVPLLAPRGAQLEDWVATLARRAGRGVARLLSETISERDLRAVATVCWMRGLDLLLPEHWCELNENKDDLYGLTHLLPIPVRCYLRITERRLQSSRFVTPPLVVERLNFTQRVQRLTRGLGSHGAGLHTAIEECARRFRLEDKMIDAVTRTVTGAGFKPDAASLIDACRSEAAQHMGNLAQIVTPRFSAEELVLPVAQARQFDELIHAMNTLTQVHYHWGTARAWNESGLSALFCGNPGTGKTMAAEALSSALDLPMYRIDLSQVINKYIGETEKNLQRIFDAAELSDCILFFDEADALFGKRTEVKDAHDRFANVEISYLLERMERFKGLAILATNRRKDLDEAFMRRLRFVIEFPMPAVAERQRIWRQVFPAAVDVSGLDLDYLAKQFQLSGGHIRSIAFNACLQAANVESDGNELHRSIGMPHVLLAVKRELEKMNRTASEELFGVYGKTVRELVA
jgi:hypothetical protein